MRETIVHMDDFVEDETQPGWTPKRIGGIEVDQKEVQRAKKCKWDCQSDAIHLLIHFDDSCYQSSRVVCQPWQFQS